MSDLECVWRGGLDSLLAQKRSAHVFVAGVDLPVIGRLVSVTEDGWLAVDQRDVTADVATIELVPLDKVTSIRAAYRPEELAEHA